MTPSLSRRHLLTYGLIGGAMACASSSALAHIAAQATAGGRSDALWRSDLSPMQYYVLRRGGTEQPFSHPLLNERRPGVYHCAGCGASLFSATARVDTTLGWPSFSAALHGAVAQRVDHCAGYPQRGLTCRGCEGHLGHVQDAPHGGHVLAVNGAALFFVESTATRA